MRVTWTLLALIFTPGAVLGGCDDGPLNECGGTEPLTDRVGAACGTCRGMVCDGPNAMRCAERPANPCGGCETLPGAPGEACGECGEWACDGEDALACEGDAVNACGGCGTLEAEPGASCAGCGGGVVVCDGADAVTCDGPGGERNGCGGCAVLAAEIGAPCGPCGRDVHACDGVDAVVCDGSTACELGAACTADGDCESGACRGERCVVDGFVHVPAGTFVMGAPLGERGRHTARENGQHTVTLSRALLVQETVVTQGQWLALMGSRPSFFQACGDECPVERVSWYEMLEYANALSARDGLAACYALTSCTGAIGAGCAPGVDHCNGYACDPSVSIDLDCAGYRLPTESEWEYFARAGTTTAFLTASGELTNWNAEPVDAELGDIAWYSANSEVTYAGGWDCSAFRTGGVTSCGTHPVRQKRPNAWGLHDITGNVWEWTWDWRDTYPEPGSSVTDPTGPVTGAYRAMRGGPFNAWGQYMRVAYRSGPMPHARYYNIGFRLVRSLPGSSSAD